MGLYKNLLLYFVAGTIMGIIAQWMGANLVTTLAISTLGPPVILLVVAVLRYNHWV